jgi:MFS superfamily sulfate permease-like transporter
MQNRNSIISGLEVKKYFSKNNLKHDLPASIVVFLVALPLCLGIALASGAPLFAGLLAGVIGGVVVASISGSQLSVSGPAAGLTVIVLGAITQLGSYQTFLMALVIAGGMQLILGLVKAGSVSSYFPSSVIEGMLAAIGLTLIINQMPYVMGIDPSQYKFAALTSGDTSFGIAAIVIGVLSLAILIYWPRVKLLSSMPAPLVVVVVGIALAYAFKGTAYAIDAKQMVAIPEVSGFNDFTNLFMMPDFATIANPQVWIVAGTIAIVASLETLLGIEAVDKLDKMKRTSPSNRELVAQGIGNMTSGMLGGLPMTSVIVRSSANANTGAKTKMSAIFHGCWLLLSLLFIPGVINMIPLAGLAAVLLFTGYKLTRIDLYKHMYHKGWSQFVPFVATVVAVLLTDLLKGVAIGMVVSIFYLLRTNIRNPYFYQLFHEGSKKDLRINLAEEVSFLNKAAIQAILAKIPAETNVTIDGTNSKYIDQDVLETIFNFKHNAYSKGIIVNLKNIKKQYNLPKLTDTLVEEINK